LPAFSRYGCAESYTHYLLALQSAVLLNLGYQACRPLYLLYACQYLEHAFEVLPAGELGYSCVALLSWYDLRQELGDVDALPLHYFLRVSHQQLLVLQDNRH